jgi:hypothetical protein
MLKVVTYKGIGIVNLDLHELANSSLTPKVILSDKILIKKQIVNLSIFI